MLYAICASASATEDVNLFIVVHLVSIGPLSFVVGVVDIVAGEKLKKKIPDPRLRALGRTRQAISESI